MSRPKSQKQVASLYKVKLYIYMLSVELEAAYTNARL